MLGGSEPTASEDFMSAVFALELDFGYHSASRREQTVRHHLIKSFFDMYLSVVATVCLNASTSTFTYLLDGLTSRERPKVEA